jgi:tetratricopeptide (TPR) repeat protein
VQAAPSRPDFLHALGVVQLQLGEPESGRGLLQQALNLAREALADPSRQQQAELMVEGFELSLAAAHEDLDEPGEALAGYDRILAATPGQPRARQGRAHLVLGWGRVDEGLAELDLYVEEDRDEDPFLDGARSFAAAIRKFRADDIHPRELLVAHRESYVAFFDEHAEEQGRAGWVAEAARMKRTPSGSIVPVIPEGARPYAAVRVDLVNPATSEVGQVGDQPMVVALGGYEALARAPVVLRAPSQTFPVHFSTQCPWDQLPISVLFTGEGALDELDALLGDWYTRGWNGEWGSRDGGRLHYISDVEPRRSGRGAIVHVDMGRARVEAVDELLRRFEVLHATHPIACVIVGRGHLP